MLPKDSIIIANGCKSVARLSDSRLSSEVELFGREIGISFQVVDDILDFVSSPEELGKPGGGADIYLGRDKDSSSYSGCKTVSKTEENVGGRNRRL